jgi:hypothetical protein
MNNNAICQQSPQMTSWLWIQKMVMAMDSKNGVKIPLEFLKGMFECFNNNLIQLGMIP